MKEKKEWEKPVIVDITILPGTLGLGTCQPGSTASLKGRGRGICITGSLARARCVAGGQAN